MAAVSLMVISYTCRPVGTWSSRRVSDTCISNMISTPVVLNGANKQKMYARPLVFEGKKAADGDTYTVIKNTPELIREIPYELSIPYHPWMKNAALILVGELDNYEGAPLRTFVNVLTEHLDIP